MLTYAYRSEPEFWVGGLPPMGWHGTPRFVGAAVESKGKPAQKAAQKVLDANETRTCAPAETVRARLPREFNLRPIWLEERVRWQNLAICTKMFRTGEGTSGVSGGSRATAGSRRLIRGTKGARARNADVTNL